jgi:tetratricopeptide (TPR) repeat protein
MRLDDLPPKIQEALRDFEREIEARTTWPNNLPSEIRDWARRGLYSSETGDHDTAIQCFQQTLALAPHEANTWNSLGWSWMNKGDCNEALRCFERAINEDAECTMAWVNKGIVLKNRGEYEEAISCYEVATSITNATPADAGRAWYNKAVVHWERGDPGDEEEAVECLHCALAIDSDYALARRLLSWVTQLRSKTS